MLVQTLRPEHPSLVAATRHDYAGFMAGELERRRALGYPPFARLVLVRLDGPDEARVERAATRLGARLRAQATRAGRSATAPCSGRRRRRSSACADRYRWQLLLRCATVPALRALARAARAVAGRAAPRRHAARR